MPIPHPQFFGQNGQPLTGCKIFTYISGTSTPQGTFFDNAGLVPNPNPVTCDAGGFVSIWLIVGDTYRILVQDQFGVQQYLVDGVVGVGGGSLSLFSTPNTWTALQTFSGGANINGGNLTGTFTGSPAFSGTPQFTTFTISNATVIANLNASLWNGTSVTPAGGALTTGFVPIISGGAAATWGNLPSIAGVASLSQLPGSGVTTINTVSCTIGGSCTIGPTVPRPSATKPGYALTSTGGAFVCTEIAIPVLKKGSNGGNYVAAGAAFAAVDATNLANTVTIPTGSNLVVTANGVFSPTGGTSTWYIALFDGASKLTEETLTWTAAAASNACPGAMNCGAENFNLSYVIAGDGASHTIQLEYATEAASNDTTGRILNTGGIFPTMLFTLQ